MLVDNTNITAIDWGNAPVIAVYYRNNVVWKPKEEPIDETVLSCFSNGYWIDDYPWLDDAVWVD